MTDMQQRLQIIVQNAEWIQMKVAVGALTQDKELAEAIRQMSYDLSYLATILGSHLETGEV